MWYQPSTCSGRSWALRCSLLLSSLPHPRRAATAVCGYARTITPTPQPTQLHHGTSAAARLCRRMHHSDRVMQRRAPAAPRGRARAPRPGSIGALAHCSTHTVQLYVQREFDRYFYRTARVY
eukprot:SAG22_NODE_181_length_16048_cov_157.464418_6_plen_122_part_00